MLSTDGTAEVQDDSLDGLEAINLATFHEFEVVNNCFFEVAAEAVKFADCSLVSFVRFPGLTSKFVSRGFVGMSIVQRVPSTEVVSHSAHGGTVGS